MASNEAGWPLTLSDELLEGLSSLEKRVREVSSEVTPSASDLVIFLRLTGFGLP